MELAGIPRIPGSRWAVPVDPATERTPSRLLNQVEVRGSALYAEQSLEPPLLTSIFVTRLFNSEPHPARARGMSLLVSDLRPLFPKFL